MWKQAILGRQATQMQASNPPRNYGPRASHGRIANRRMACSGNSGNNSKQQEHSEQPLVEVH